MASIDIDRVRSETPGSGSVVHLNNAGAALPPQPVVDEMIDYLRLEADRGGYETADRETDRLDRVYRAGARLLNCQTHELALTSNASEAWWRAFTAVPLRAGDRVLTDRAEYVSNALGLLQAEARGVEVVVIPDDRHGQVDVEAMRAAADERVKLIALTHAPTNNGLVNPAAAVGHIARSVGALYLLDACQSVGQIELDVEELGCDFLGFTGRKFLRGPRGTGMLFVRSSVLDRLDPPGFIDGHSAAWAAADRYDLDPTARRFELFETGFAAKAGLGVAIDYAVDLGLDAIAERVDFLARRLRTGLQAIDGVDVRDRGERLSGIVTFDVEGLDGTEVKARAGEAGINVSLASPSPWQSSAPAPRPMMTRASPHYYNTEAEVDRLCEFIDTLNRTR